MNPDIETNYYINNVSPYIDGEEDSIFYQHEWNGIAACYMWGTTGFVFNPDPELVKNEEDVAACNILTNSNYYKSVTVKDNVRDAYFAALSILYEDELNAINADESLSHEDKNAARRALLNDTDADTIAAAEDILKDIKDNVYSFETDSGKTDMVTGKVIANYQWSGDAVYIMDQADEEDTELWYSVPEESTNLWFDGWVMLKDGMTATKTGRLRQRRSSTSSPAPTSPCAICIISAIPPPLPQKKFSITLTGATAWLPTKRVKTFTSLKTCMYTT